MLTSTDIVFFTLSNHNHIKFKMQATRSAVNNNSTAHHTLQKSHCAQSSVRVHASQFPHIRDDFLRSDICCCIPNKQTNKYHCVLQCDSITFNLSCTLCQCYSTSITTQLLSIHTWNGGTVVYQDSELSKLQTMLCVTIFLITSKRALSQYNTVNRAVPFLPRAEWKIRWHFLAICPNCGLKTTANRSDFPSV